VYYCSTAFPFLVVVFLHVLLQCSNAFELYESAGEISRTICTLFKKPERYEFRSSHKCYPQTMSPAEFRGQTSSTQRDDNLDARESNVFHALFNEEGRQHGLVRQQPVVDRQSCFIENHVQALSTVLRTTRLSYGNMRF
jgi:hypothetical protein